MSRLEEYSSIPAGFLECEASELYRILDGPTLIHLSGAKREPLFICTLLHGNETTGLQSLQRVLKHFDGALPRSVSMFIGNVEAARYRQRHLPSQLDYNRIWSGGEGNEHAMTRKVLDIMADRDVFACIDIHNNTGRNPHYAIVATQEEVHLALARRFGHRIVYATYPDTSCSAAFSKICPAVTLEAGVVGDASGVDHVSRYLIDCIQSDDWRDSDTDDFNLYHTVAVVKVRETCSVGILGEDKDIELLPDVDRFNFHLMDAGTQIGTTRNAGGVCLSLEGVDRSSALSDYLTTANGELRTVKPIMPAMLTTDCEIIKMDCLCYLMERLL
ncbi:MAG: M14 family metallopeptidase [Arenicellales bacterium]|nr:M14 family metallopeptidase [Arenicellales bacterium]